MGIFVMLIAFGEGQYPLWSTTLYIFCWFVVVQNMFY